MRISSFIILVALFGAGLDGCAQNVANVSPDWTTYPVDRAVEKPVSMWVAPQLRVSGKTNVISTKRSKPVYESDRKGTHSVTYDFVTTEKGDTAEKEVFVTTSIGRGGTEKALLNLVNSRGKTVCGGDFRVAASHYYTGSEATVQMMGIRGPSLKVTYRCPANIPVPLALSSKPIREVAEAFQDHAFFDVLYKTYPVSSHALISAVKLVANREGIPIIREGKAPTGHFILAGKDPNKLRWGRIEQLAALIEEEDRGASITFLLLAYQHTYHTRGVLGGSSTKQPGVAPLDRKAAYSRAVNFLGYVDKQVVAGN